MSVKLSDCECTLYVVCIHPISCFFFLLTTQHTQPSSLTPHFTRKISRVPRKMKIYECWRKKKVSREEEEEKSDLFLKFKGFSALCNGEWKWTTINYLYTRFSHRSTRLIVVKLMNYCLIQEFYKYLIMRHDDSYSYKNVRDETFFFFFIFVSRVGRDDDF